MTPDNAELLFVYGTLRPALAAAGHAHLVRDLDVVGRATVPGVLVDLGEYPGLVSGAGLVHGELLRITDPARLVALDAYEDCGAPVDCGGPVACGAPEPLFHRVRMVARLADGTTVDAWGYRCARPPLGALIIASGDYAAHVAGH